MTTGTPSHADLLCAFANTLDVDVDATVPEALLDAAALTAWLRAQDLIGPDEQADDSELRIARSLRSGLRTAMLRHHDDEDPSPVAGLDVAARLPLRVDFDGTSPRLAPAAGGVKGGLARLLVAVADAQAAGDWVRVKVCIADECQWAFYDTSKNRSRHWCSMGVCGNRQKTRTYRARRRANQ
ncbi:CGNR zinc finger domain-containing protein [Pseudonocardia sp. TRM90224]|uniref:CGNR zinc finger domain-containing protein n=1 Tax=Pseudonocardia sp. TRM90224 TaxID=2812678 RepID=UPI001E5F28E6|nr:CGNR zinc finger domain-containing protein [Pseudonocardia sp. TRM90224]